MLGFSNRFWVWVCAFWMLFFVFHERLLWWIMMGVGGVFVCVCYLLAAIWIVLYYFGAFIFAGLVIYFWTKKSPPQND